MSSEFPSREACPPSSSTITVSEYFNRVRNITIGGFSNFSTVHGNQNNYYHQEQKKATRYIVSTQKEEAEYEQFPEVLRSQVIAFRNVYSQPIERYDKERHRWVECGQQVIVAGEIAIRGGVSKCMAVSYSGERAEEAWKEDFRRLGGIRCPENAQLVAINLSSIPMLILAGDLVPMAHLADRVGKIGWMYLKALRLQMDCYVDDSLWMDTSRGVFCRGPEGPFCGFGVGDFGFRDLPLDAELIKEDVLVRYLASRNQDREVIDRLRLSWAWRSEPSQITTSRPTVISTLTDRILAVESGVWWEDFRGESCPGKRGELANGATSTCYY